MSKTQEEKLKSIIHHNLELENVSFRQWFLKQFKAGASNTCTLEDFAVYFLNTLRQCTEVHLKASVTETPNCQTPVRVIATNDDGTEDLATSRGLMLDLTEQNVSTPKHKNFSSHSTPRLSTSADRFDNSQNNETSTPVRRNASNNNSRRVSITPNSANKSASSSSHSICLGDFIVINNSHNKSQKEKKKTASISNQPNVGQTPTEKPKKRLQPISISKKPKSANTSSIFAGESSFSNENNILKISNNELEDKDQCAILAARKSLKLNASKITKEIQNVTSPSLPVNTDTLTTTTPTTEPILTDTCLDLKKLENNIPLKRLAEVYTIIIDLNLTTNILNELSFLLNLLNTPNMSNSSNEISERFRQLNLDNANKIEGLESLEDISYAVYFALLCLAYEKENLALLDAKSLNVVLIGDRFSYLPDDVKTYLLEAYQRKQQLITEKIFCNTSTCFDTRSYNNVYFQQEQDSRENFTSYQEFGNYRVQRDLFCKCIKIWETNHLNPMWQFSAVITPKIRKIFEHSENCINMAHLAKLFVSQLLLSALNSASPEEIGLDVDIEKFSKLTQRLIAPSQFSVDYQFPRNEAFFRDFILESRSLAFIEQLKIELYTELISKTDTSFDYINLSKAKIETDDQSLSLSDNLDFEYIIVKPDILNSMLILAKFLGFTTSLPYNMNSSNIIPPIIEKNQISLRALMQSTFDICVILEQGIQQNRLLVTIPWLVQYLAMLDNITLQLEHYMKALKLMFALYSYLGVEENHKRFNNTFLFIIKLCLGWLFESKQFIAEQYYNFRTTLYEQESKDVTNEMEFVRNILSRNVKLDNELKNNVLNAYLESILPIACPFLAEFRVSIMPAKYAQTKNASRSGRYRHMTTRIAELQSTAAQAKEEINIDGFNNKTNKPNQVQNSLIQAFLHSQSSSTRQLINFCIERCYKSVVKDGQVKFLLPAKTKADNLVNQITSNDCRFVYNNIQTIYNDAYLEAKTNWDNSIANILQKRIRNALESLLPEETLCALKSTYFMIIKKEAMQKISQWFYANIVQENFFCANLQEMANKICSANTNKVQLGSSQLLINKESPCVSNLIDELQYWLYCASVRVDRFQGSQPLIQMFRKIIEIFDNTLPTLFYNLLSARIIQLLQNIIAKHCIHLTAELIEAVCNVWLHPNMKSAMELSTSSNTCIYDSLITIPFIESLGIETNRFNKLADLIVCMVKKEIISLNYVNDLVVSLFKHEWHPNVLEEISKMLRTIAKETATIPSKRKNLFCDNYDPENNDNDDGDDDEIDKSNLFLDMLADLSRDVDFF